MPGDRRESTAPQTTQPDLAPLAGFRVGVAGASPPSEIECMLRGLGAQVLAAGVTRLEPVDADALWSSTVDAITRPPDVVIATSDGGLAAWLGAAHGIGLAERLSGALRAARLVAVGPAAAASARSAGLEVDVVHERLSDAVHEARPADERVLVETEDAAVLGHVPERAALVGIRKRTPCAEGGAIRLIAGVCDGDLGALVLAGAPATRALLELAAQSRRARGLIRSLNSSTAPICTDRDTADAIARVGVRTGSVAGTEPGEIAREVARRMDSSVLHIRVGPARASLCGSLLTSGEARTELSRQDRMLLTELARASGTPVAYSALMVALWDERPHDKHALEAAVGRLRRRLQGMGLTVQPVRRRGYRLVAAAGHRKPGA